MSGFDQFAPYSGDSCLTFLIGNLESRMVKVFHHPLMPMSRFPEYPNAFSVNLMQLKGVSSSDIKSSLEKGELRRRLDNKQIIIMASNIALFEPDNCQKQFLKDNGVTIGVDVGSGSGSSSIVRAIERIGSSIDPHTEHTLPGGLSYVPDVTGNGKTLWVYTRGILRNPGLQSDGADYEETSPTSITFYNQLYAEDYVVYFVKQ